jgi:hypothetical protein
MASGFLVGTAWFLTATILYVRIVRDEEVRLDSDAAQTIVHMIFGGAILIGAMLNFRDPAIDLRLRVVLLVAGIFCGVLFARLLTRDDPLRPK